MVKHLDSVAITLARFLTRELPVAGGSHWWESCVNQYLSLEQQRFSRLNVVRSLDQLDLRALLRLFDKNWTALASQCRLHPEVRTWAREIADIRNRLAHRAAADASLPLNDQYRILETICRVQSALNDGRASASLIRDRNLALQALAAAISPLKDASEPPLQPPGVPTRQADNKNETTPILFTKDEFRIDRVTLRGPVSTSNAVMRRFDGEIVDATSSFWSVRSDDGLDLGVKVLMLKDISKDDSFNGEVGQVFCESSGSSDIWWKSVVRRLRIGIRALPSQRATMDIKLATCSKGSHPVRKVAPLAQIDRVLNFKISDLLIQVGCVSVGRRSEILRKFPGKTRDWPAVVFDSHSHKIAAIIYFISTVIPLLPHASVKLRATRRRRKSRAK